MLLSCWIFKLAITTPEPLLEKEGSFLVPANLSFLPSNAQRSTINENDEEQVKFALTAANFTACESTDVHYRGSQC